MTCVQLAANNKRAPDNIYMKCFEPVIRAAIAGMLLWSGLVAFQGPAFGRALDTTNVQYVWDLSDLYPTVEAWMDAKWDVEQCIPVLAEYEGRLGESPEVLQEALDVYFDVLEDLHRLVVYASLKSDEDVRVAEHQEREQEATLLLTEFSQATSYIRPEIVSVGEDEVTDFLRRNRGLEPYDFYLRDILREADYTLGSEAEGVLAAANLITDAAQSTYNILSNADMPWPELVLPDGDTITLDQSAYSLYRGHADRDVRRVVFDTYWQTWNQFENTHGSLLASEVKSSIFSSQARRFPSALAWALSQSNVPVDVYEMLVEQTTAGLETLHRYLRLRGQMLGVDQMHYYDIYPPLLESDLTFPVEEAKEITLAALEPLGPEYGAILERGLNERWMHAYPQPGKRSGAYMAGAAYDVHPYVLLNHVDDYRSLSTFVHEWGHAVHSVLASQSQPFAKAGYSTFTAEVASIINEVLLQDHLIRNARSDEEKLFYLGQVLEGLRGTFFRQAMFAEFELAIHQEVEQGNSLSGRRLTQIYGDLLRRYHGHDQGVVQIDETYAVEWAYILHFFSYDFYVYQYATSMAGGVYFAQEILDGGQDELENFLSVLRAGGSDHPYEILRRAGVDLATPAPYQALVVRMNEVMDQIEEILDGRRGP